MNTKKIYIIKYYGGSYEDAYEVDIFVTSNKKTAINYVNRFNSILKKWLNYYEQYTETDCIGITRVKDEYKEKKLYRWYQLKNIRKCYFKEIEVR